MPRLPVEYSRSVIYKICCIDKSINDIYIGSTTDFSKRKYTHKYASKNEKCKNYNFYVYQFIRENSGWENFEIIQLEEYPCNNKRELEKREEQLRTELNATLNNNRCWSDGKCKTDGCDNNVVNNGVCKKHGATRIKCKFDGCDNKVQNNGVCIKHGATSIKCKFDGCDNYVRNNGVCRKHGATIKKYTCKVDGCDNNIINNGVCRKHGATKKSIN